MLKITGEMRWEAGLKKGVSRHSKTPLFEYELILITDRMFRGLEILNWWFPGLSLVHN